MTLDTAVSLLFVFFIGLVAVLRDPCRWAVDDPRLDRWQHLDDDGVWLDRDERDRRDALTKAMPGARARKVPRC